MKKTFSTLNDILRFRAEAQGNQQAYIFLSDGESEEHPITYAELDRKARAISVAIREFASPGERVLLLYPSGLEYLAAFFGCLYAGVISVPAYPPRPAQKLHDRNLERIRAILEDSDAKLALTTDRILSRFEKLLPQLPDLGRIKWMASDAVDEDRANQWREPRINSETIAFLQYTSGSTGLPKGVMISHQNVIYNERMLEQYTGDLENAVMVGWLPMFHDLGLIGTTLQPMHLGFPCYFMAPAAFLQKPSRWVKAISRYRATTSGGPNFAYELCARKTAPEEIEELDLSSWVNAFCGAEPIHAGMVHLFEKTFGPSGFSKTTFNLGYGLAEATCCVTGTPWKEESVLHSFDALELLEGRVRRSLPGDENARLLAACGKTCLEQELLIVDPETFLPVQKDGVGEIWVSGDNVARGYWNRPDETAQVFQGFLGNSQKGPYLRTGDMGFLEDEYLFIAGRLKDLIVIRGRNHYPQDLERTSELAHAELTAGSVAAFAVQENGEESLVLVQEVQRRSEKGDLQAMLARIREELIESHEMVPADIVLVKSGSIPRTTSGKIQRRFCRERYQDGRLQILAAWKDAVSLETHPKETPPSRSNGKSKEPESVAMLVRNFLLAAVAKHAKINPESVDIGRHFTVYGLDSAAAIGITGELEELLGRRISPTIVYEYPSIEALSNHLGAEQAPEENPERNNINKTAAQEPIAIVGLACRFPGADNPEEFRQLLLAGGDSVTEYPEERFPLTGMEPGLRQRGGYLKDVDLFDPEMFGISPREAPHIDPQQRLLLRLSREALEDAGLDAFALKGDKVGVYLGISTNDYSRIKNGEAPGAYDAVGNALGAGAGRISYVFGFNGPSMSLDTACSSSLVALHLACNSLRDGESEVALVGGVNLILSPDVNLSFLDAGLLSQTGSCKPFDAAADGIVRSEGAAVLALKPLSRARKDGDEIYALVRGSAVNQDGASNGLLAPNLKSQKEVLREAYRRADVNPTDVAYVEAHGTGTLLGDPIEAEALGAVLGQGRNGKNPCLIGSVKSNIGHTEAAAGIAGVLKTVLMLKHRTLLAGIHFKTPNPYIPFEEYKLKVVDDALEPKLKPTGPLFAGVSSFGFSGTNAHIVLEAPARKPVAAPFSSSLIMEPENNCRLLTFSAHTAAALKNMARDFGRVLEENDSENSLRTMAFQSAALRGTGGHRLSAVFQSKTELQEQLINFIQEGESPGLFLNQTYSSATPRVYLVFSGQGAKLFGAARKLYDVSSVFRETLDECNDILLKLAGWSLTTELGREEESSRLKESQIAQPVLTAIQAALTQLWRASGVKEVGVVGHSLGEVAGAWAAGALSLRDALTISYHRGRLIGTVSGHGGMAFLRLSSSEIHEYIGTGSLCVAAMNDSSSTVVSGASGDLEGMFRRLDANNVYYRKVEGVDFAAHSPQMESILEEYRAVLGELRPGNETIPFYSTVMGSRVPGNELDCNYWARNIREPVLFSDTIRSLLNADASLFLEIGAHPLLSASILETANELGVRAGAIPTLRRDQDDVESYLSSLAALYTAGVPLRLDLLYSGEMDSSQLPDYPYQENRYWLLHNFSGFNLARTHKPVLEAALNQSLRAPLDLNLSQIPEKWELLEFLTDAYIEKILGKLEIHGSDSVLDIYVPLLERWRKHPKNKGQALDVLLERARIVFKDAPALIEYLESCGNNLWPIIHGEMTPLETLFPDGSTRIAEDLYHNWAGVRYFNDIVAALTGAMALRLPEGARLRILEAGAGSGGTTRSVLPVLNPERTSYAFTDLSDFFFKRAREHFPESHFLEFGILNLEVNPVKQGYAARSREVVVAANSMHAVRDIRESLNYMRELLVPGGMLVLYEATVYRPWFDITTGLIEGWQRFEDGIRKDVPLISAAEWKEVLLSCGFENVQIYPEQNSPAALLGQNIIVAFVPGGNELFEQNFAPQPTQKEEIKNNQSDKTAVEFLETINSSSGPERRRLIQEYVARKLGAVVRVSSEQMESTKPLVRLGFDSLMGIELKNRIEKELSVKLSISGMFKELTMDVLAERLDRALLEKNVKHRSITLKVDGELRNAIAVREAPSTGWYFEHELDDPHHFNVSQIFILHKPDLDILKQALEAVFKKYDLFRFRYFLDDAGSWKQFYVPDASPLTIQDYEVTGDSAEEVQSNISQLCSEAQHTLNLTKGPISRANIISAGEHGYYLQIVIHHLIFDGFSWLILLGDLEAFYQRILSGKKVQTEVINDYRTWTTKLLEYSKTNEVHEELPFWEAIHKSGGGSPAS